MAKKLHFLNGTDEEFMDYKQVRQRLASRNQHGLTLLAIVCLLSAAAMSTVAIGTNHWLVGRLHLPPNTTNDPIITDIDIKVGLKETCFDIVHRTEVTNSLKMGICISADKLEDPERTIAEASMKDFTHIFVCMCAALATCVLALAASCLRLSGLGSSLRKLLLFIAACFALLTVTSILTAVAIAQSKLHGDAEFIRAGLTDDVAYDGTLLPAAESASHTRNELSTFRNLGAILMNSSRSFSKGFSFMLACGGSGAVIMTLVVFSVEIVVNRQRIKEHHSTDLLSNNFTLNEKGS